MTIFQKSYFWYIFAIIFTLLFAYYQRVTGPTYPKTGDIIIADKSLTYKLLRSNDSHLPAEITVKGEVDGVNGYIEYRRFRTNEPWIKELMVNKEGKLIGYLPPQPPAGKLEYRTYLEYDGKRMSLLPVPVVIRFKGAVPMYVLIPHVIFMFSAMLFSTRTGIEAMRRGKSVLSLTWITVFLLGVGGLILGPVVQKFAFDAFWTGWPFGHDLTDNKTLVTFLFWVFALIKVRKSENNRKWVYIAAAVLLIVFLIPHSMFGSELDYSTGEIGTGK
ncbi:MAG: hypothetical protein HUU54_01735 [Ignavibacteriaceae bacterium]|nr:hypothetical protein [Ignavibacteriaceae bacterium]